MELHKCESVYSGLREVDNTRQADNRSVDSAESCEAKDFGSIVTKILELNNADREGNFGLTT